jgi:hypothetical protein
MDVCALLAIHWDPPATEGTPIRYRNITLKPL